MAVRCAHIFRVVAFAITSLALLVYILWRASFVDPDQLRMTSEAFTDCRAHSDACKLPYVPTIPAQVHKEDAVADQSIGGQRKGTLGPQQAFAQAHQSLQKPLKRVETKTRRARKHSHRIVLRGLMRRAVSENEGVIEHLHANPTFNRAAFQAAEERLQHARIESSKTEGLLHATQQHRQQMEQLHRVALQEQRSESEVNQSKERLDIARQEEARLKAARQHWERALTEAMDERRQANRDAMVLRPTRSPRESSQRKKAAGCWGLRCFGLGHRGGGH